MPIERTKRGRKRKGAEFSAAELQWLTGEGQADANPFDALELEYPAEPRDFNRMDSLLDRAALAGVVEVERIAALRRHVVKLRADDRRRFPKRDEYVG